VAEADALREIGIGTIAVMPNDTAAYREDSFDNMRAFAARHRFTFPYVIDETQEVARGYGAQCTPDFFGFNARDELQYRGRLDASRTTVVPGARRELFEAMRQVAETGAGPLEQLPAMGCSIKWKD
jgi:AhpC/TSA family